MRVRSSGVRRAGGRQGGVAHRHLRSASGGLTLTVRPARLRALGSAGGNAAATIIEGYIAARQDQPWAQDKDAAPIHDALCVAYALDPNVVGTADTAVSIDTVGFHTYGRTIVDPLGRDGGTPNVSWAHSADAKLFSKLLFGALSG